ncbi:Hypothetical protein FKW44_018579 [Caligus rogercresseyi]|uniref:Uncharacterized protein n=1 Tax=Caligus rogercresseyi TaxID=217165 RepID=A0A7T8JWW4_CALRO|nr:Hypothetical protein FKW44_018579 [Caligus rogercresseyi]
MFWGYKPTANGPSGSAEHTRSVLALQTHRQWALGFRRTHAGVLGLQIPCQWDSRSAKPNRGVLGLQIPRQWALGFCQTQLLYLRVTNPLPMGPRVLPNTLGVFWGYKSPANGPLDSAEHTRGVLGLQIPRQWALTFRLTHLLYFRVISSLPMGARISAKHN